MVKKNIRGVVDRLLTVHSKKLISGLSAGIVLGSFILVLLPSSVGAATITWDGGGADNNWSTCTNWSTNTCPLAADNVVFNGTSTKNATIDASFQGTVANVTIASGYTGTISVGRTFTVSGTFSQATASFNAGAQTLNFNVLTITSGTFTASSGVSNVGGSITIGATATFVHNSGTLNLIGISGSIYSCSNATFNLVTINKNYDGYATHTMNSDCTFPLGNNPTAGFARNNLIINGTLTGSGTLTIAGIDWLGDYMTITFNPTGRLLGFTGYQQNIGANFTVNGATIDMGNYTSTRLSTLILQNGGVFTAPSGTMDLYNSLTINPGTTFNHNNGTINLLGVSGGATYDCNNTTFNRITITKYYDGYNNVVMNSNCTFPLGSDPTIILARNTFIVNGTLSGSGTLNIASDGTYIGRYGNMQINATGQLVGFNGLNRTLDGEMIINGGTLDLSAYNTVVFDELRLQGGAVLRAPSGTMTVTGSVIDTTGGTLDAGTGTVLFSGYDQSISCMAFNQVSFSGSYTKTITSACTLPLGNNPTFTSTTITSSYPLTYQGTGTLSLKDLTLLAGTQVDGFDALVVAGSYTVDGISASDASLQSVTVSGGVSLLNGAQYTAPSLLTITGNFNTQGGTFIHNSGLVRLGCGYTTLVGSNTFYDFESSPCFGQLTGEPGQTLTVLHDLVLNGGSRSNLLNINSTTGGSEWTLDAKGSVNMNYVDIRDVHNAGPAITAINSTGGGNIANITLVPPPPIDAYKATDIFGQINTDGSPLWTQGSGYNGAGWSSANREGLSYPQGTALDTARHLLFIGDCGSRVVVHQLDTNNLIIDRVPEFVIGQADFVTEEYTAAVNRMNCAVAPIFDAKHNRLFVIDNGGARVLVFDLSAGIVDGMNASYVLGQSDFTSSASTGCSWSSDPAAQNALCNPYGGAVYDEERDYFYVSDSSNARVLVFDLSAGISNGMNAAYVLGQTDFTSKTRSTTRSTMNQPSGLAYNSKRSQLFVADQGYNADYTASVGRVLVFDLSTGIANGMNASYVLGQLDFTTTVPGSTVVFPNKKTLHNYVTGVTYDTSRDRLFVQDDYFNRILVFDLSAGITNYMDASAVIGQENFTADDYSCIPSQANLCDAEGLSDMFDTQNNRLYVSDSSHARVLVFDFITLTGAPATQITASEQYSYQFQTVRSQNDVSYSITQGALPAGMTLSNTGLLSGKPTVAGTYSFTVQAKDNNAQYGYFTDSKQHSVQVLAATTPTPTAKTPTKTTTQPVTENTPVVLNAYPEFSNGVGKKIQGQKGNSVTYVAENAEKTEHILQIKEIQSDTVTIVVGVGQQEVKLAPGQSKDLDVTNDGVPDITVTVESVTEGVANITYKQYVLGTTTQTYTQNDESKNTNKNDTPPSQPQGTKVSSKVSVAIFVLVPVTIVGFAVLYVLYLRHRSKPLS